MISTNDMVEWAMYGVDFVYAYFNSFSTKEVWTKLTILGGV